MRRGVRIGIDVGKARVGVARTDPDGLLATPVETLARSADGVADIGAVRDLVVGLDALEVIVGLPIALSGRDTASTQDARDFAAAVAQAVAVPVRLVDERLSTVSAQGALRASGRKGRSQRSVIDQVAAVIIVQHALDLERSSGRPPGRMVDVTREASGDGAAPATDERQ
ncbi:MULTISPECIES: Holliday junction resolvase RuvX [unclassified Frigoribacterium]|uniref:Holliday junction resolvase RuvX n=1 Tax=unclassified Frigoribacterium TaxID=2627005 RepID=UPI0006F229FE|nr:MULTISPECIES: Holliday junction resolvase RuvX [unclassified Frigoribacterium]KQM25174.1 Holliday junction resolvase [Frigoribacterium sp. Leaf8]MBD8485599.1 Holliday junction resolvase RuvX [Frigoribacterium sp. CFBP 8759]WAC50145.1 Holliday junction resolvase RuvX [Frigoribacterium sp. SL97]